MESPVEFDPVLDPAWGEEVDRWQWMPMGTRTWRKSGKCTRCGHQTTVDYTEGLIAYAIRGVRRASSQRVMRSCQCRHEHAKGQIGCGVRARVAPPEDA